jgi:hypothetical protein
MVWVLSLSALDLSTQSLTAANICIAFGVRLDLVGFDSPAPNR